MSVDLPQELDPRCEDSSVRSVLVVLSGHCSQHQTERGGGVRGALKHRARGGGTTVVISLVLSGSFNDQVFLIIHI